MYIAGSDYLEFCKMRGKELKPQTINFYKQSLLIITKVFGDDFIQDLTTKEIYRRFSELKYKNTTKAQIISWRPCAVVPHAPSVEAHTAGNGGGGELSLPSGKYHAAYDEVVP